MDDRLEVNFFGGNQWKAISQIKTHLVAKHAVSARARTVAFKSAVVDNMAEKLVVLFHLLYGQTENYLAFWSFLAWFFSYHNIQKKAIVPVTPVKIIKYKNSI